MQIQAYKSDYEQACSTGVPSHKNINLIKESIPVLQRIFIFVYSSPFDVFVSFQFLLLFIFFASKPVTGHQSKVDKLQCYYSNLSVRGRQMFWGLMNVGKVASGKH